MHTYTPYSEVVLFFFFFSSIALFPIMPIYNVADFVCHTTPFWMWGFCSDAVCFWLSSYLPYFSPGIPVNQCLSIPSIVCSQIIHLFHEYSFAYINASHLFHCHKRSLHIPVCGCYESSIKVPFVSRWLSCWVFIDRYLQFDLYYHDSSLPECTCKSFQAQFSHSFSGSELWKSCPNHQMILNFFAFVFMLLPKYSISNKQNISFYFTLCCCLWMEMYLWNGSAKIIHSWSHFSVCYYRSKLHAYFLDIFSCSFASWPCDHI